MDDSIKEGAETTFYINCKDKRGQPMEVTPISLIGVDVTDNEGRHLQSEISEVEPGKYLVKYTSEDAEKLSINVTVNDEPLAGFPKDITVTPVVDPKQSTATRKFL